ncbi:hypothetical protein ACSTI6_23455, partial [Vibrio parahaemolyticus]
FWAAKLGGVTGWDKALQDGVLNPAAPVVKAANFNSAAVAGALASTGKKGGAVELVLYEKVGIGAGQGA